MKLNIQGKDLLVRLYPRPNVASGVNGCTFIAVKVLRKQAAYASNYQLMSSQGDSVIGCWGAVESHKVYIHSWVLAPYKVRVSYVNGPFGDIELGNVHLFDFATDMDFPELGADGNSIQLYAVSCQGIYEDSTQRLCSCTWGKSRKQGERLVCKLVTRFSYLVPPIEQLEYR